MKVNSALGLLFALSCSAEASENETQNVILMIADGMGPQSWDAASYYQFGELGRQAYDNFPVKMEVVTRSLGPHPGSQHVPVTLALDPNSGRPIEGSYQGFDRKYPHYFEGYKALREGATDSAAAATAMASGLKAYNGAINWTEKGGQTTHLGQLAVRSGRSLGVVTSVEWSNATPAAFLAHNASRHNQREIAKEVIATGLATVVMGAGNPNFDHDGRSAEITNPHVFDLVGGEDAWRDLVLGRTEYRLIQTKDEFERLANGTLDLQGKYKVIGSAPTRQTLQFLRAGAGAGEKLTNQPSLSTMSEGALHLVSQAQKGFFLMVEGGATDWAANVNNLERMVEEQAEFNDAVRAVVRWVETESSWDETLLIVTADHGNGLVFGPNSDSVPFQPIKGRGAGVMPEVMWHSDDHTSELVPLFAKGKGAAYLRNSATHDGDDDLILPVIDNTQVFTAISSALGLSNQPPSVK